MKWLYDELHKREITVRLLWSENDYEPIAEMLREIHGEQLGHLIKRITRNGA